MLKRVLVPNIIKKYCHHHSVPSFPPTKCSKSVENLKPIEAKLNEMQAFNENASDLNKKYCRVIGDMQIATLFVTIFGVLFT